MDLFAPELSAEMMATLDAIAGDDPDTVALAWRVVTDPHHAAALNETERRCAWLLLLALRRLRRHHSSARGTAA